MFHVFKCNLDSLEFYWRVWEKTGVEEAKKKIESFYGTKLDFIEGIK